ncbi:MAG: hypothetical protein AB7E47_06835 [Desulfovibrionaceae bacterium]
MRREEITALGEGGGKRKTFFCAKKGFSLPASFPQTPILHPSLFQKLRVGEGEGARLSVLCPREGLAGGGKRHGKDGKHGAAVRERDGGRENGLVRKNKEDSPGLCCATTAMAGAGGVVTFYWL